VDHAPTDRPQAARAEAAAKLLAARGSALRALARRLSICADDADDALQRATEILLTKAPPIEGVRLTAWMAVVTRREALALRRSRERLLAPAALADPADATDIADTLPSARPGPDEALAYTERVAEARSALRPLKDAERLAIFLQAQGYSYAEICELCGWTYTKVNRCLAEGRARLRSG
jgi:RNA polymerase sigma factor (sigma-70 family)